jgi:uncharacterized protein
VTSPENPLEKFAVDLSINGLRWEDGAPAPGRLLSGNPRFRTWDIDAQPGGLFAGVWESTPGRWRVEYDEWEYFRILSGISVLTADNAAPRRLATGDSMILRPGFKGIWEVVETTRKEFVIRL